MPYDWEWDTNSEGKLVGGSFSTPQGVLTFRLRPEETQEMTIAGQFVVRARLKAMWESLEEAIRVMPTSQS